MIDHLPDLIDAGIDSLKVEGRMKTALYVAVVSRTYRQAIDDYLRDPAEYERNLPYYRDQISRCTYRDYTTGFFYGKPGSDAQIYDNSTYRREYTYLGMAHGKNAEGLTGLEQRNKFYVGENIEIMKPDGRDLEVKVLRMVDEEGNPMDSCPHPKQRFYVDLGTDIDDFDILRREERQKGEEYAGAFLSG